MDIRNKHESQVQYYGAKYPTVLTKAINELVYDKSGKEYIDFFSGAGSLNIGHNNPAIKIAITQYLEDDNILQGLDFNTIAKHDFIETFVSKILEPRNMDYKIQFTNATGTNAVEAALKLARKLTGRQNIISFMGGYHGISIGSLSVTANKFHRKSSIPVLNNVTFIPFESGTFQNFDSINLLKGIIEDELSGIEKPAAIIIETVQGEGGVNVAPRVWLIELYNYCKKNNILFISDDIQVGCGRTGPFFSWEDYGIMPDMITLSKSISGIGLPMSLLLIRKDLDIWEAGEHNGTFRGNQLAFVGGKAFINYWLMNKIEEEVMNKSRKVEFYLKQLTDIYPINVRNKGLIFGIDLREVTNRQERENLVLNCFNNGVIAETCGREGSVLKLLPPLTIRDKYLQTGIEIITYEIKSILKDK